jgi:hypothetical protein
MSLLLIRVRHLGAQVALPVRLGRAPRTARGQGGLFRALPQRGAFLVRKPLGRLAAGARGRLLHVRHGECPLTSLYTCMCLDLSS